MWQQELREAGKNGKHFKKMSEKMLEQNRAEKRTDDLTRVGCPQEGKKMEILFVLSRRTGGRKMSGSGDVLNIRLRSSKGV